MFIPRIRVSKSPSRRALLPLFLAFFGRVFLAESFFILVPQLKSIRRSAQIIHSFHFVDQLDDAFHCPTIYLPDEADARLTRSSTLAAHGCAQRRVDLNRRLLLQAREDVGIRVERNANAAMAEAFTDDLWVDPRPKQLAGMGVP